MTSKVGRRVFGKMPVTVSAQDIAAWGQQDVSRSWNDEGVSQALVNTLVPALQKAMAAAAHEGAAAYISEGEVGLQATDKDVLVGFRIWNNEASMICSVSLRKLIADAFSQARSELGHDPQAQALVSALIQIGQELSRIPGQHNGPPAPLPAPRINRNNLA